MKQNLEGFSIRVISVVISEGLNVKNWISETLSCFFLEKVNIARKGKKKKKQAFSYEMFIDYTEADQLMSFL